MDEELIPSLFRSRKKKQIKMLGQLYISQAMNMILSSCYSFCLLMNLSVLKILFLLKEMCYSSLSSDKKTSSRLSSFVISSIVPLLTSFPSLIIATLSQSFSATSNTWVE